MAFRPLHDRVLVRRIEADQKTAGGIIIPDSAQEKPSEGEVIAVGSGARNDQGTVTPLEVKAGDRVEPGQPVAVVEAMKMENILRAEKAATVKATPVAAGESLAVDQVIVEFE